MYNQYLDDNEFVLLEDEPQVPSPGRGGPQGQDRHRQNHPGQGWSNQQRSGQAWPNQRRPGQAWPNQQCPGQNPRPMGPPQLKNDLVGEITGGLGQLLDGVLKHFSLENFDTGDILLVLIILFLYLEGDNLELVITLGLMLLLGLDDKPKEEDGT